MLRRCAIQLALITLLGFSSGYPAYAQSSPAAPRTVGSASEVVVRGKIVGVDRANKVVTIAGPEGHTIALRVTDPYNLKAAKVEVVRSALQNAASVASLLLTTECMVAEKPEEKPAAPAMPPGGMM